MKTDPGWIPTPDKRMKMMMITSLGLNRITFKNGQSFEVQVDLDPASQISLSKYIALNPDTVLKHEIVGKYGTTMEGQHYWLPYMTYRHAGKSNETK